MVNRISGMGFNPVNQSNFSPNSSRKPGDLTIKKGMTVDFVSNSGSTGQQIMAEIFDFVSHRLNGEDDGVYNKREAEIFNSFEFQVSEQKNEMTLTNKENKHKIVFKFDNIDDFKEQNLLDSSQMIQLIRDLSKNYESIECDFKNKAVTFSNGRSKGIDLGLFSKFDKITLNNCENMFDINANGFSGKLILNNVHDQLFGVNRKTRVYPGKANIDSNTEIKIKTL